MNMHTKTVLVTGGAGYIGSACVKALCENGYKVVAFDNLSTGKREYVDVRANFVEGDILSHADVEAVFESYAPEIMIHLAGLKSVREGEEQPERYYLHNVTGTENVLNAAASHGVEHILFSSTAVVYKPTLRGTYSEEDVTEPMNVYGMSKLAAENAINKLYEKKGIPAVTIFRYFNVAGDTGIQYVEQKVENLLPVLLRHSHSGSEVQVFGDDYETRDGTCIRDYIHLADIVDAHMIAIAQRSVGTFNLGTSEGTSVLEMVAAFEKVFRMKVAYEIKPRRQGDVAVLLADADKARKEIGWEPRRSLQDILSSLDFDRPNTLPH